MTWINTGINGWHVKPAITRVTDQYTLFAEDQTGAHWMDTSTGDELVLLSDGGWRMVKNNEPYLSRYRLFRYFAATHAAQEISYLLNPIGRGEFDASQAVAARYQTVRAKCVRYIDALFAADPLPWSGEAASSRKLMGT